MGEGGALVGEGGVPPKPSYVGVGGGGGVMSQASCPLTLASLPIQKHASSHTDARLYDRESMHRSA